MLKKIKKVGGFVSKIVKDTVLKQVDNRYLVFDNTLTIHGYNEEERVIYLRKFNSSPMHCVELTSSTNLAKVYLELKNLANSIGYENDAKVHIFYSKSELLLDDGNSNDFCTKQSIYIFSPSQDVALSIAEHYDLELLPPKDIILAILDLGLANKYYNDLSTLNIKSLVEKLSSKEIFTDEMGMVFKTLFAEGIYKTTAKEHLLNSKSYKIYQGYTLNSAPRADKPDIQSLMSEKWTGYVSFSIEFSRKNVELFIKEQAKYSKLYGEDKVIKNSINTLKEDIYPQSPSSYVVVNSVAVIDNERVINRISNHMNIAYFEKTVFAKDLVYKTPLLDRDLSGDFLMKTSDARKYLMSIHKTSNIKTKRSIDMYGKDIYGNYITYSFSETNSPHVSYIAATRSGKTVNLQKTLFTALGVEVAYNPDYVERSSEELLSIEGKYFENKVSVVKAPYLGDVKVVHFDTGYSCEKSVEALKMYSPDRVDIYRDDVNFLRFGLTDVRYDKSTGQLNMEDMLYNLGTMSLIIELENSSNNTHGTLDSFEKKEIIRAYEKVFQDNEYEGMSFGALRADGGYIDIISKVERHYGKHIEDHILTTELENLPDNFSFIQKPLLSDIILILELKSKKFTIPQEERNACESAKSKISGLSENQVYGLYSSSQIRDSDYFYMELDSIKSLGDEMFVPVFLLMIQRLYRRDVVNAQKLKERGLDTPKVFYVIEEARNLFEIDSLRDLLTRFLLESARYGIHLIFITQNASFYHKEHLVNIGSKIVMPSDKPDEQIPELRRYWFNDEEEDANQKAHIEFFKKRNSKYTAFVKYGGGLITVKPYVSKEEEWLFNSNSFAIST
ncbi:MAG: DNA helicase HerA-like ATPase [uncultured Sulfurovum sp.]|uniref:DNA helicase HerA-like ATPase n=1 Tax=uncultured Sulfurovum sp. TaxID=269237 RepID=A0A6S6SP49_9BACT|nr:MAG: DNA helicase HerA-like ATPase [uncultured Sulfurovum sp.]